MPKRTLHKVDLKDIAVPVKEPVKEPVKAPAKKKQKKIIEKVEEERPVHGQKTVPVKVKKPPTEKQLAAREKLKQARLAKLEEVRKEREDLEEAVRAKEEEINKKKKVQAEKRRLKREEKKKAEPKVQFPEKVSEIAVQPPPPEIKPRFNDGASRSGPKEDILTSPVQSVAVTDDNSTPVKLSLPNPVKPEDRYRTYHFGKNSVIKPRFR